MDFLTQNPTLLWIVLAVIFMIIEGLTIALVTIWFVGGAIAAMIVSFFKVSIIVQIGVFFAVSLLLLLLVRPYMRKTQGSSVKTNADNLVGKKGIVTRPSSEFHPGQGRIMNQIWTIEEAQNAPLTIDTRFEVIDIRGVKLIVKETKES